MTTYPNPVTIRLPDDLHRKLKKEAKRRHTKVSEVVRQFIRERMEEDAKDATK